MFETLMRSVDNYCERTDASYWSEPLNAVSNLGFVVAGLWGVARARGINADGWTRLLCWWVVIIGIGSFLFHTHGQIWAAFADVVPIAIFVLAYILYALRRFSGFGWLAAIGIVGLWLAASALVLSQLPSGLLQAGAGSMQYTPVLVALVIFAVAYAATGNAATGHLALGAATFAISLGLRALDQTVCAAFPFGTHFLWHLGNSALLAILLDAALKHGVLMREGATGSLRPPLRA